MAEYIEREALIAAFYKDAERCGDPETPWDLSAIETEIEAAPAADVAPVVRGYNKQPSGMFECSVCGWMDWDTVLADGRFNYCPNCGARMDGDGNG